MCYVVVCCVASSPCVLFQVHAESPSEDTQLVEHLKELMEELGPYTEAEDEEDQGIEEELEQDSEEEDEAEDNNAMDTS